MSRLVFNSRQLTAGRTIRNRTGRPSRRKSSHGVSNYPLCGLASAAELPSAYTSLNSNAAHGHDQTAELEHLSISSCRNMALIMVSQM
jgi:hypothetical protein